MKDCLTHLQTAKPYRTGSLGLSAADLLPLLERAAAGSPQNAADARRFFETNCQPVRVLPTDAKGQVTAFYEPEVDVSRRPDETFKHPFY
ncbi:MAG: MltA domain-containing protein, partial [Rhizobium sp.]|nr:MltA domain-containing protein [Rhizobium sp.]